MGYKGTSLANLINYKNHTLFLPHIQRPFVWDCDQVVRFIDSLMKNYPIQTFLLWKTKDAIKARKFMDDIVEDPDLSDYYDKSASEKGREKVFVLDGQQRLQSLFTAYDGTFNGKDIYINILDGESEIENGISYRFKLSNNSLELPYFKIKSLTADRRNAEDIAYRINEEISKKQTGESSEEKNRRERIVRRNIAQLVSLLREDKYFWIEELDGVADDSYPYRTVLNIFIRVNNGGTKLDSADLMFAAMKESWAEVEENIETIVEELNSSGRISFDKDFVLKSLMLVAGKGATLDPDFFTGAAADSLLKTLEQNWPAANKAFEQLRDFIYNDLKVYSEKVIRSYNAFIPIFEYLFSNPSPTPEDKELVKSYYYRAQLFNWYSSKTEQILNAIHNILIKNTSGVFPLNDVKSYFGRNGKETTLTIQHLGQNRLRFIILNLIYVEQMGSSPFNVAYKGNEPHIDHIYPKSKLKNYSSYEVNHIGNYRFIGASDNLRKRAEEPSSYFKRLKVAGVNISRHLLVDAYSNNPDLLVESNYRAFRDERLKGIFAICNKVVNR